MGTGGTLNYGGYSSAETDQLLAEYLRAPEDERQAAMLALCRQLRQDAPILPVCFKSVSVLLPSGAVEAVTPTAANPFYDLPEWTVDIAQ